MSEELKPCLWCNEPEEFHVSGDDDDPNDEATVECGNCFCCGPHKPTRAEAITAWNTRPSPWISVTPETMPERKQSVFVTNGKTVKEVRELFASDDDGVITVGASWEFDEAITHWMPIPELPSQ